MLTICDVFRRRTFVEAEVYRVIDDSGSS